MEVATANVIQTLWIFNSSLKGQLALTFNLLHIIFFSTNEPFLELKASLH